MERRASRMPYETKRERRTGSYSPRGMKNLFSYTIISVLRYATTSRGMTLVMPLFRKAWDKGCPFLLARFFLFGIPILVGRVKEAKTDKNLLYLAVLASRM